MGEDKSRGKLEKSIATLQGQMKEILRKLPDKH